MITWQETINIANLHRLYVDGKISLKDLGKAIVEKLKETESFLSSDPELIDIMCSFEAIDELAQIKDYIAVLDLLYEFGDFNHKLWIEAEDVDLTDGAEIIKTRNPLEEIEHQSTYKGPYLSPALNAPASLPKELEEWDGRKIYDIGAEVRCKYLHYRCKISCSNVDPGPNSYGKPNDCWIYLGTIPRAFDSSLVFPDRITCSLPISARAYPSTRKYHYMAEEEFNKKLLTCEINPANMPRDLYSYMKDCEIPYQEWLIKRWSNQNLTFRIPNI